MLALEDLKDLSMEEVLSHLAKEYAESEQDETKLKSLKVLIAYESVGNWGMDSTSFFLLEIVEKHPLTRKSPSPTGKYGFWDKTSDSPTFQDIEK